MTHPVQYSRAQIRYSGRIDRAAFCAWTTSTSGRLVVQPVASAMRFALLGKARAARNRIWRQLTTTARTEAAAAALQREADDYLTRLGTFVHARGLPCTSVDLHRLIAVPRLLVNGGTERRVDALMTTHSAFRSLPGGKMLRDWFIQIFIDGIEAAMVEARPSPSRPHPAGSDWIVVGVNREFEWRVPFRGPAWPGHYYLLELTRSPITRATRKAAGQAIGELDGLLQSLPRDARAEILRQGALSLEDLESATSGTSAPRVQGWPDQRR